MFKKWLEKRRKASELSERKNGFNWAAGALLRKELTPYEIEGRMPYTGCGKVDPFDKGAMEAICMLTKGVIIEDDHPMF